MRTKLNYFCGMNMFRSKLLTWYEANRRELPWRGTKDPYRIWISEVILQQTRVEQGTDYFLRFIRRFPNVKALAMAHEDEVMKYWQGLGYYSRARNLHAAARSIQGDFPQTYEEIRALKGVGDYTAAAICSFAYDMPHAVVDGNVYRVLSRYLGIDTPIDSSEGKKLFMALADEMLDKKHSADYNQAIMDFGALQCTPHLPNCMNCPLRETCMAFAQGRVAQLPVKQHKTKTINRYFHYIYVRAGAYTYISKRTKNDIWKNLYELPLIETKQPVDEIALFALPEFSFFLCEDEKPISIRLLRKQVKHVLSHQVIYADFYELILPENTRSFATCQRVEIERVGEYAVPRLIQGFLEKYL